MYRSSLVLSSLMGAVASIALCIPSSGQTLGCTTGGAGGPIPTSGTGGGGTYPTVFPPSQLDAAITVASIPPGATVVTEVRWNGLTHTWVGDLQFVLTDPGGSRYNVFNPPANISCDFGGNYAIVGECAGGMALPGSCTGAAIFPAGTYDQYYGSWPSGTSGVSNVALHTIPAATGVWTLTVYDWAGGDVGALTSWDLCFGAPPALPPPTTAPALSAPANGGAACNPVDFSWSSVACATGYDIDIDGSVTSVAGTSHSATLALGPHTWRVRAKTGGGPGPWSATFSVTATTAPSSMNCVTGGAGGMIPSTGSGDGTWPSTLPTYPLIAPLTVTVPAGATQIVAVKLNGWDHTWVGDLHVVLEEPAGLTKHTLVHRPGFTGAGFGLDCDPFGNYVLYESCPGQAWPTSCPATSIPPGDYVQHFGNWPSGTNGIANTGLSAIPISSGVWNLYIYDWAAGDIGTLIDWELCFDSGAPAPVPYCTPSGPQSDGCVSAVTALVNPNTSHTSGCTITISDVPDNRFGIVFYGTNGSLSANWCAPGLGTSMLCVVGPPWRTGVQPTGGGSVPCDGTLFLDWDAYQLGTPGALGQPWAAGDQAWVQGWYRSPADCRTTVLTEAVELTYQ